MTPDVPSDVLKKIRHGWIAVLIQAAITLVVIVMSLLGVKLYSDPVWQLVDVLLMCGLAYGIYRKSRICAVAVLVYFVAVKIAVIVQTGRPTGIDIWSAIFAYFYVMAVVGTFTYHKLRRQSLPVRGHG